MAAFLTSPVNGGRDDYIHLLSSPAQQPWALFASPAPAVQDGRLSFDVLTSPGVAVEDAVFKARSHSHLELFTLERSVSISLAQQQDQQQELRAALTEKLVAKVVDAKQTEVEKMVAGVAAKYGLAADYSQAEDTIKAVWAEQSTRTSWAHAASEPRAGAVAKQHAATAVAAAEEATLGRDSSANASGDEEAGQQVTSMLKAAAARQAARMVCGVKRTLDSQVSFSFQAPTQPGNEAAGTAGGVQKRRRVQYDRMRELESQVQRVRLQGDSLGQSLRQAQIQHAAATSENEQLWNALLHIHASLRAAHAAQLRQQVAMHTAAVAAALPLPEPAQAASMPAPTSLFGGLFSPDAADLAASCGMFVSPNKQALELAAHTANNKPRKLFLEESGKLADGMRPGLAAPGNLPADLASLWMQAA